MHSLRLIRHGAVVGDGVRRYLGRTDLPMNPEGEVQIMRLADRLRGERVDAILCSDLSRSRRSAEILAEGRDIAIDVRPCLREIDMGDWEGLAQADLARREPEAWAARGADIATHRPPGGESFADLRARVAPLLDELSDPDDRRHIVLAGHAGVNRVILCSLLGMALGNLFRLSQDHGCLSLIEWHSGRPVVRLLGATPTDESTLG